MNRKHGLIVLAFVGFLFCAFAIYACNLGMARTGWKWLWFPGAIGFAAFGLWILIRPNKVPDVLAEQGLSYFECEGFCFAVIPAFDDGECWLHVLYQNRYDSSCAAEILFVPESGAAKGAKKLRLNIHCSAAGDGRKSILCPLSPGPQSGSLTFDVGADVDYPEGWGELVRYKDGLQVMSIRDVESGFFFMTERPSRFVLSIPYGFVARPSRPEVRPPTPAPPISSPFPMAMNAPHAPGSWTPDPTPIPEILGDAYLQKLLENLKEDTGLQAQARLIRGWKIERYFHTLGLTFLGMLLALALVLYAVIGLLRDWRAPHKIHAFIVGAPLLFFSVPGFLCALSSVSAVWRERAANSIKEACEGFIAGAFENFSDQPGPFVDRCQHLPETLLRDYYPGSFNTSTMMLRWRDLREKFVTGETSLVVPEVFVEQKPTGNPSIVEVIVRLKGKRFGELAFRNFALGAHGKWLLATPEPLLLWSREFDTDDMQNATINKET